MAGIELAAVASGTQAKADAAATAFGAKAGYADGIELIRDENVDIVTIAVKVADHRELVLAAAAAGKHIYCEWPLGRNLAEAKELAAAVHAAGVHAVIGLQTRANPAAKRACDLIASGAIGCVLSARVLSSTVAFGKKVEGAMAFAESAENGVTLVTIQGAHTVDLTIALLGGYADLTALITTQFPEVEMGEGGVLQPRSTPDHMLLQARMQQGSALSVEVAGGRPPEDVTFHLEVIGETGTLGLESGAVRGFQSGSLNVLLNGKPEKLDRAELAGLPETATNVAGLYLALQQDIVSSTFDAPDFQHAVRLTRLIEDAMTSSAAGERKQASGWPSQ